MSHLFGTGSFMSQEPERPMSHWIYSTAAAVAAVAAAGAAGAAGAAAASAAGAVLRMILIINLT